MLVAVLVIAGIASLAVGILAESTLWAALAVGCSAAALTVVFVDWWRSRSAAPAPVEPSAPDASEEERPVDDDATSDRHGLETDRADQSTAGTHGADVHEDMVKVAAGRARYHALDCTRTGDDPTETITLDEAVGEGFTACTVCLAPYRSTPLS